MICRTRPGIHREDVFLVTLTAPTGTAVCSAIDPRESAQARDGLSRLPGHPLAEHALTETLDAMNDLIDDGVVNHIGVSNVSPE